MHMRVAASRSSGVGRRSCHLTKGSPRGRHRRVAVWRWPLRRCWF